MKHLTEEALAAWCDRELAGKKQDTSTIAHLDGEGCTPCRARTEDLRTVLQALRTGELEAAPEAWIETAFARIRQEEARWSAARPSLANQVRRLVETTQRRLGQAIEEIQAALVVDSHAGALLPGIRAWMALQPRQLLFVVEDAQIHLALEPKGKKFEIAGQFLPLNGETCEGQVVLVQGGKELRTELLPTGEFSFPAVPSGEIDVHIEWAGKLIRLAPLVLEAGA